MQARSTGWMVAIFLLFVVCVVSTHADEIVMHYSYNAPELTSVETPFGDEAISVEIPGCRPSLTAGHPELPVCAARILLPQGHSVESVEVLPGEMMLVADDVRVKHSAGVYPISQPPEMTATADRSVYESAELYPGKLNDAPGFQKLAGAGIATVNLYPVAYQPSGDALYFHSELTVVVKTSAAKDGSMLPYRGFTHDKKRLQGLVDNYGDISTYTRTAPLTDDDAQYIIITSQYLETAFQTLLDHRQQVSGLTVDMVTVEDISANYSGVDTQQKIRTFIQEAYAQRGTEYVLLGGDVDQVPYRGLWSLVGSYNDNAIPADQYYANLDGVFNYDGDSVWGEAYDGTSGGVVDMYSDISVGRIPASNQGEANYQINKTILYETAESNPVSTLWIGEQLDTVPTYGGNDLDYLYDLYVTPLPRTRLYERDGTHSRAAVISAMNSGSHQMLGHLGHSSSGYNMGLYSSDVNGLSNTTPFFVHTQGCLAGKFEVNDSIAEYFVVKHDHGAFAIMANSRYGWYSPGTAYGPSTKVHKQFLYYLLDQGQSSLGDALASAKDYYGASGQTGGVYRWIIWAMNLLGDPYTPIDMTCDADGDGVLNTQCGGADCNDNDADVYPGAEELCDGQDNDCDGSPDADEADADEDGFMLCEEDCDDTQESVYPGAPELCDGIDNNCDDQVDEGCGDDDDDDDDDTGDDDDDDDTGDDDTGDDDTGDDDTGDDDTGDDDTDADDDDDTSDDDDDDTVDGDDDDDNNDDRPTSDDADSASPSLGC